jgi:hypothetical protein
VKIPRFRLVWVMVAVVIAALDFAAIRAVLDSSSNWSEILLVGILPMSNVLAVGLLMGQRRPGSTPFLLGFETFGAMALASYVALSRSFPGPGPMHSYVSIVIDPVVAIIPHDRPFVFVPIACSVVVVMLGLPQLAFALIGGFLSRRYKVTITRR